MSAWPAPVFPACRARQLWGTMFVRVWHKPSGVVVEASGRSQLEARKRCKRLLRAVLAQMAAGECSMPAGIVRTHGEP